MDCVRAHIIVSHSHHSASKHLQFEVSSERNNCLPFGKYHSIRRLSALSAIAFYVSLGVRNGIFFFQTFVSLNLMLIFGAMEGGSHWKPAAFRCHYPQNEGLLIWNKLRAFSSLTMASIVKCRAWKRDRQVKWCLRVVRSPSKTYSEPSPSHVPHPCPIVQSNSSSTCIKSP